MMRKNLLQRGISLIVGLCLFLPMLTTTVAAAELKPFLTLKLAGAESLLKIAEKIADLSGTTQDFQDAVAPFQDLKGFNAQAPAVFILRSDGDELKEPILYLPIEDLDAVELPGFEMITSGLKKDGDKYLLNSPLGGFEVRKTKGYYVVTPQGSEGAAPDDPAPFIVGMEKYDLAFKFDFENTSFESIEMFLAPFQMIMAMQGGPEAAQAIEQLSAQIELVHKELRTMTYGLCFDPKTSSLEISGSFKAKDGTNSAKQIARFKDLKTTYSGFLGGQDIVFSINAAETDTESNLEAVNNALEQVFTGILEQVELNAEEDEDIELAEAVIDSIKKIIEATLKKGTVDYALSLDAEGTLLGASTVGDTEELKKLVGLFLDRIRTMHDEDGYDEFMKANLKKEYLTVEGFKLSSLTIPLSDVAQAHDIPEALQDKTVVLYWALKENEAVAFAAGFNGEKTEATFKKTLEATKTPVALQQPMIVFSLQPLGKLLKNAGIDKIDSEAAEVVKTLIAVGNKAKVTVSAEVAGDVMFFEFKVDGKVVETIAEMIKSVSTPGGALDRTKIRDF